MTHVEITRTGVRIGQLYRTTALPHHDADAQRLQDALLGNPVQRDWDGIAIVLGCALIALAVWGLA